LLKQNYF